MKLLLVEDSKRLRESLSLGLRKSGYIIDQTGDGEEGCWMAMNSEYDVVLLDVMLPRMDGLTILRKLREKRIATCVLMLTARDKVENKVEGLRNGADDYLVKPFAMDELLARINALCRRSYKVRGTVVDFGSARVDLSRREITVASATLELKPREYRIVEYLAMRAGETVPKRDIEAQLYDDDAELRSNVVESAVSSIRRKFADVGEACPIQTRRGFGYFVERA